MEPERLARLLALLPAQRQLIAAVKAGNEPDMRLADLILSFGRQIARYEALIRGR